MKRTRIALTIVFAAMAAHAGGQSLPTGFVRELIAVGTSHVAGLAFLPDGRLITIEAWTGTVRVRSTSGASATIGTIPGVAVGNNRGLLGVAADPLWPAWPYLYFQYAHAASQTVRVVRYTATGDVASATSASLALADPYLLIDDAPDIDGLHNGGTLAFGPDGSLYVALGDDGNMCAAANLEALAGVILRLDAGAVRGLGGTGPPPKSLLAAPGHPFGGTNGQLVHALGLRNPFRFDIDPVTGHLVIADVGNVSREELDLCTGPGQNFGWPWFEGTLATWTGCGAAPAGLVPPIAEYPHAAGSASIVSFGGVYRNVPGGASSFGPAYEGNIFYGDFNGGFVDRLVPAGSGFAPAPPAPGQTGAHWAEGLGLITDAAVGPDGALWYTTLAPGQIHRIRPDGVTRVLEIVSGDGQAGNAGSPLLLPIIVRLTTPGGTPVSGAAVLFGVAAGSALVSPLQTLTGPGGEASATVTLLDALPDDVLITVSSPSALPVTFTVRWRGLIASFEPAGATLALEVRHSEVLSPVTVAVDAPPPAPFVVLPFGALWTSIAAPQPTLGALDGLGLLGPPLPGMSTGSVVPRLGLAFPGLPPLGGLPLLFQAYAVDAGLLPSSSAFLISNPVTLVLP